MDITTYFKNWNLNISYKWMWFNIFIMSMRPEHKRLYKLIDGILWNVWDPIGVNEYQEARDEYDDYIPEVFKLVINNTGTEAIAQYLFKVETERMGLLGNIENCRKTAERIILTSV